MFELIGSMFAIGGSYLLATNKVKEAMSTFMVGNVLMSVVAIETGLLPLLIQLMLFTWGGLWALFKIDTVYLKKYAAGLVLFAISILAIHTPQIPGEIIMKISPVELFAATFAVTGNFLMRYGSRYQIAGFILFIIADILYVKIGVENALWFFTIQTVYFLVMSIIGIKNRTKSTQQGVTA